MIKVFAIEPEFMVQNHRFLRKTDFGYENGRLVGLVPKKWRKVVQQFCYRLAAKPEHQLESKRIEALLSHLSKSGKTVQVPLESGNGKPDDWVKYALSLDRHPLWALRSLHVCHHR